MAEISSPQPAPTTGRTRIPVGTLIFHDHGVSRWPACGNEDVADPETEFDVSLSGDTVKLKAPGFGGEPYRNGCIFVKLAHWQEAWGAAEIPAPEGAELREKFDKWWPGYLASARFGFEKMGVAPKPDSDYDKDTAWIAFRMGDYLARAGQSPAEGDDGQREPAPLNDLPSWSGCDLIISNHEFRQRAAAGLEGQVLDLPPVTPPPTALHRFIHEYDDADPYRSDWFMHRLELVVKEANVQPNGTEAEARLTREARVGGTTFGINVPERLVIEAAQRAAEHPQGLVNAQAAAVLRQLVADNAGRAAFLDAHPAVSKELTDLIEENERLLAALQAAQAPAPVDELREMEARKDAAYEERNRCVALIARMAVAMGQRVAVTKTAIEGWSEDWHGCIYIELPTGQVSWHFHDSQAALFAGLPTVDATWDGHDTPEKYRRVDAAYVGGHECPGLRGDDPRGCWRVRCQLGARCAEAPPVPSPAVGAEPAWRDGAAYSAHRLERSLEDCPDDEHIAIHRSFLAATAKVLRAALSQPPVQPTGGA